MEEGALKIRRGARGSRREGNGTPCLQGRGGGNWWGYFPANVALGPPELPMEADAEVAQPLASVIVNVYVPADKLDAVALLPPDGAHE